MPSLDSRPIVVTGASGNLGRAVCSRLLRAGARVFAITRDETRLRSLLDAMTPAARQSGGALDGIAADLTREEPTEAAFEAAVRRFGAPWGAVLTVGGWTGGRTVRDTAGEELEAMFRLNVGTTFNSARAAMRRFDPESGGRLLTVSSLPVAAGHGLAGAAAYAASKGAVLALTRALAEEGCALRVTVNCLAPEALRTSENAAARLEGDPDALTPPSRVAEAAAFLLSTDAEVITGAVIPFPVGPGAG